MPAMQLADATSGGGNGKRRRSLTSVFRRNSKPATTRTGSTGTAADAGSKESALPEPAAATLHGGGRRPAAGSNSTTAAIGASADGRKKKGGVTSGVNYTTKCTRNNNNDKAKTPFRRGSMESLPSVCLSSASSSPFQSAHSDLSSGAGTCSAGLALSNTCTTSRLNNQTEAAAATAQTSRADQAEAVTADATPHADQEQTQTPDAAAAAEAKAALSALSLQHPQVRQPTTTSAVAPAPTHAASESESGHFTRHHHPDPDPDPDLDPNHQSLRPPPPLPPIPAERRRRRRASVSTSISAPPAEGTTAEISRQQKQKEHEFHVGFHPMVMFATVPSKAELSDEERSAMFWTGEEESSIRRTLKRQIQIIKARRERRLNPQTNDGTLTSSATTTSGDGCPVGPVAPIPNLDAIVEEEERTLHFCCRGLEHYLIPREERRLQTAQQKLALQAVLDRQRWQLARSNVGPMDDASSIGSIFAEATSHSRAEAFERAAKDEAEARKVHTECELHK